MTGPETGGAVAFPAAPEPSMSRDQACAALSTSCELCEAARFTHWYHEDRVCWVADCEVCDTPMVVWRFHGTAPAEAEVAHMIACLETAGRARFGATGWAVDRVMRQIPDHFHAHVRDPGWSSRRWESKPSRYTGVGGNRVLIP